MKYKYLVLAMMMLMALLSVTAAFASVAATELNVNDPIDNITSVPASISYLLSKNADQVKIEIVPVDTNGVPNGPAVRTWTFTGTAAQCLKGNHSFAAGTSVQWDGKNDGGIDAPSGSYKIRITATGAAATDLTKFQPIWESIADLTWRVYDIAVNTNPNSRCFGRVYVTNYQVPAGGHAKAVYEFLADGTLKSQLPVWSPMGGTAPFSLAFDGDDHLYVADYSKTTAWRYSYNAATDSWFVDPSTGGSAVYYARGLAVNGSGANLKMVASYSGNVINTGPQRFTTGAGADPPASTTGTANFNDDQFVGTDFDNNNHFYVAGTQTYAASGYGGAGSVTRWNFAVPVVVPNSADPTTLPFRNSNLTVCLGLSITSDQQTMWLSRMSGTYTKDTRDGTDASGKLMVKVPLANFETANPYDGTGGAKFYGFNTAYNTAATTYSDTTMPGNLAADAFGNVAATGGQSSYSTQGYFFGLYEEPSATAPVTTTTSRQTVYFFNGDYSPQFINGSSNPTSIPCNGTTKATITVNAQDANGFSDIANCKLYCPALGYGVAGDITTGTPMNRASGSGNDAQYKLDISAPPTAPTGATTIDIYINDVTVGVMAGHGTLTLTVTGGEVTGTVLEGVTGDPAANVDVQLTGTVGGQPYTRLARTNASGVYSFNVNPGTGYVVDVVRSRENITTPAEFNPTSQDDPTNIINDWPKSADATLGGVYTVPNARVWPLQVTQVFYHWNDTTPGDPVSDYKPGGREVCVKGIVMRPAADDTQKGNDGFYWIYDTLHGATQCAVKIRTLAGEPAPKMGDMVVVTGDYNVPYTYKIGSVTPVNSPAVVETGKALPVPRPIPDVQTLGGYLVGGLYGSIKNRVVSGVVTPDSPIAVGQIQNPATDGTFWFDILLPPTPGATTTTGFRVRVDTPTTTGITTWPATGDQVYLAGVVDEYEAWSVKALRPAIPSDVEVANLLPDCGGVRNLPDDALVMLRSKRITAVGYAEERFDNQYNRYNWNNGLPVDVAYLEDVDRQSAVRIHCAGMVSAKNAGVGDQVTIYGVVKTSAEGEKYVEIDTTAGGTFNREISKAALIPVSMNSKAANSAMSQGLYVKMAGKVEAATGGASFILNDGGIPMKVYCGTIAAPSVGANVKVRGIISSDGTSASLLVFDALDIAGATEDQSIPLPGKYRYFRNYMILGPFTKTLTGTTDQAKGDELMATDFMLEATGTPESDIAPSLGETVTYGGKTLTWTATKGLGQGQTGAAFLNNPDACGFIRELPGTDPKTYCVSYAVVYLNSKEAWDNYTADMTFGCDDQLRVFLNKTRIFENHGMQGAAYGKYGSIIDSSNNLAPGVGVTLNAGPNCLVFKVVNGNGEYGVCANVIWSGTYDSTKTFGNGSPIWNLGYYPNKPAGFPY